MPIRGSCHCGKIAYSLDADPTVVNLRCAEDVDLSTIKITQFDGASL